MKTMKRKQTAELPDTNHNVPWEFGCHLEPELNTPSDSFDLVEDAREVEPEFRSIPLDAAA
jgi:hypothetical protein